MNLGQNFARVAIDVASAGTKELIAGVAGKVNRLHGLHVSISTTGTVLVEASTGGGTPTKLTGEIDLKAKTPLSVPFDPRIDAALAGAAGRNLQLVFTNGGLNGYAVVSQGSS